MPSWLVSYDISVSTQAGRRRARKVRKTCNEYGERLPKSVYLIVVPDYEASNLVNKLHKMMEPASDRILVLKLQKAAILNSISLEIALNRYVI